MKNSKHAFSLIEALIILMLISIAIMGLIPLLSKKVNAPKWMQSRENPDTITFGTNAMHRVGFGGADPYTTDDSAKVAVSSLAFGTNPSAGLNGASVNIGYTYDTTSGTYTAYNIDDSLVVGMNTSSSATNSLIIKSGSAATDTSSGIDIGGRILSTGDGNLTLKGTHPFIVLNGYNFDIKFPDDTSALKYVANTKNLYVGDEIKTTSDPMLYIGADGSGTLTLKSYGEKTDNDIPHDYFECSGGDTAPKYTNIDDAKAYLITHAGKNGLMCVLKTKSSEGTISSKIYYTYRKAADTTQFNCQKKISQDASGFITFCAATKDADSPSGAMLPNGGLWNYSSDKRLKNILSDFNKGMNDLENLETYNFTYKSDAKQRNHVGLIAQKLKGVYDEALHQDEKGYLSYEKEPIMYSMVNAVKEIFKTQKDFDKKQTKLNKKADKLIRMYE